MSKHSSSGKPTATDRISEQDAPGGVAKKKRYAPPWAIPALTLIVAVALFAVALSGDVYEATTIEGMRIAVRKVESVVAFSLVGYLFCASLPRLRAPMLGAAAAIALYSAAIEVAQAALGSTEGLGWNAADIACGAAGGCMGGWAFARMAQRKRLEIP